MRYGKVLLWSDGDDARWIYVIVGRIVVTLDVVEVYGLTYAVDLVEIA